MFKKFLVISAVLFVMVLVSGCGKQAKKSSQLVEGKIVKESEDTEDLGNNYKLYNEKVYYWDDINGQVVFVDLDPSQVETFNGGCVWDHDKYKQDPCGRYAKDKNYVFYKSAKIENVDTKSFQIVRDQNCPGISTALSRDKDNYYLGNNKITKDEFDEQVELMEIRCFFANSDEWVVSSGWRLISGDPNDSCTTPTYSGKVSIRGWYEWKTNYTSKQWVLHVDPRDSEKLIGGYKGFYSLSNVPDSLAEKLKEASEKNPILIEVIELGYYCEGFPGLKLQ